MAFLVDWQDDADRKEETLAIIADLLGFSWTGKLWHDEILSIKGKGNMLCFVFFNWN